jgi:hypothetical protein
VANEGHKTLTDRHALGLYVIWLEKEQRNNRRGMSNEEICVAVRKELTRTKKSLDGTSLANVKKNIEALLNWKPTHLLLRDRAGNEPFLYRLPKGALVTMATTARMLIELDNDDAASVERRAFTKRMLQLEMQNSDTKNSLTEQEIDEQIDYCRGTEVPYILQDDKGFIKTTERIYKERAFLERISTHCPS